MVELLRPICDCSTCASGVNYDWGLNSKHWNTEQTHWHTECFEVLFSNGPKTRRPHLFYFPLVPSIGKQYFWLAWTVSNVNIIFLSSVGFQKVLFSNGPDH